MADYVLDIDGRIIEYCGVTEEQAIEKALNHIGEDAIITKDWSPCGTNEEGKQMYRKKIWESMESSFFETPLAELTFVEE
jgi:hypothetical protein